MFCRLAEYKRVDFFLGFHFMLIIIFLYFYKYQQLNNSVSFSRKSFHPKHVNGNVVQVSLDIYGLRDKHF
jgi:hypothetical protein